MRDRAHTVKTVFLALSIAGIVVCYVATLAGFLKYIGFETAMLTMIVSGIGGMAAAIAFVVTSAGGMIHHSS